jgi:hypothetical protein
MAEIIFLKVVMLRLDAVAQVYNPSYLRSRDWEGGMQLEVNTGKTFVRPYQSLAGHNNVCLKLQLHVKHK